MAKLWKRHQFLICFFTFGTILLPLTFGNLVSDCSERCSSLATSSNSESSQCDTTCISNSCFTGCSSWDNSTLSACHAVCNETYSAEPFRVQHCQSGCLFAENEYAQAVIVEIGEPSAPIPSNIGATNLSLSWTAASNQNVMYLVEWRYVDGTWNYYGSGEPISETSLDITDLIPYATYQFRVVWVITPRHTLTSLPGIKDVTTLASGVPSTAPTITNVVSSSPTTISLTWDPPPFPNGPITGYRVGIRSFLNESGIMRTAYKTELTIVDSYRLRASTLYEVSVRAVNDAGAGVSDFINVTTAAEPAYLGIVPYLVVGVTSAGFNSDPVSEISTVSLIMYDELGSDLTPSDVHTVDNENSTITDVAVHYWKNFIFISDSDGRIHRRTIDPANLTLAPSEILYTNQNTPPTKLDVDWLNEQLYFVQGTEILRCNLNVSDCSTAVANIGSVPEEMKVDPYSGYLFWSVLDVGILRTSLTTSTIQSSDADIIVRLSESFAFMVHSDSFQILYSNSTGNSLHSASLDGSNQQVMHRAELSEDSSDGPQFINVTSIVYFNNSLTWTFARENSNRTCNFGHYHYDDNEEMFFEEETGFSQQNVFICVDGFHGLDVFYPSYQPIPIPEFPPTDFQVLFSEDTADVTWTRPLSIPGKGAEAWEEWLYEIILTNLQTNATISLLDIQDETAFVDNLNASTEYSVQVRAYSVGGTGPMSEIFSGSTLIEVDVEPYLVLANSTDIWRSQLDGNAATWVLSPQASIKDLDWYQGYYIWSSTMGVLYRSAEGTTTDEQLTFDPSGVSSSVDAIAIDWLSEFIYWADPDRNQIFRGRLSNETTVVTSPMAINAFASNIQDMAIDSVQAYVYWTSSSTVEASRLNGESPLLFYEINDLSLDVVAGLTLDLAGGYVYWFVVSRQSSTEELMLYRAQLAGISDNPVSTTEEIGEVLSETTSLALHFYSSKLFWINSQSRVEVSDDRGQRRAFLPATDVQALTIVQETLKPLPVGYSQRPTVVAQEIPSSSIQVTGTWNDFNITWQASTEVTYGIVFYTIVVTSPERNYEDTVQDAFFNIQDLSPFQSLNIRIRPYTYWATAPETVAQMTSPMSVPSVPQNPRAFALETTDIMTGSTVYSAEFRWSQPAQINGIFEGYNVSWGTNVEQLTVFSVSNDTDVFTFANLTANTTYFFQVEGFTSAGSGPATEPVNITTGASPPPPTILVSRSSTGVVLTDTDTNEQISLLGGVAVSVVAFVASEEKVFYIESSDQEIYKSNLDGTDRMELLDLGNSGNPTVSQAGFVIDWVSQILYWSDSTAIYSFDTTLPVSMAMMDVIYTPPEGNTVQGITVNPHGNSLIWTETTSSSPTLVTSDLIEWAPTPLFGSTNGRRRRRAAENCTCSDNLTPGSAVYVDASDPDAPTLFFVDSATNDLWTSDLDGCMCNQLFQASSQSQSGLPPDSLSVDRSRVYWSNTAQGVVASIDKRTGADFQGQTGQTDVNFVLTYGTSLQPYPAPECLTPQDYTNPTELATAGSDSLTVTFDPVLECEGVSTATPIYTVDYAMVESNSTDFNCTTSNLTCNTEESTSNEVTLNSLEPYTFYLTQVSVRNLYSMGSPILGPVAIHRTTPGVPSVALSVAVAVLTPSEVNVTWSRPQEVNGPLEGLRFRIKYSSFNQDFRSDYIDTPTDGDEMYSVILGGLSAATEYTFIVESYQASLPLDSFSSSASETRTTFQAPARVEELSKTSTTLTISWMAPDDDSVMSHWFQYREASASQWQNTLSSNTTSGVRYSETIGEGETDPLLPYSTYQVRARVLYTSEQEYEYTGSEDILSSMTNSDSPGSPGMPTVTETGTDPVTYEVRWMEPTSANGPGDLMYTLEARAESTGDWVQVYEGSNNYWIIVDLSVGDSYTFRVKASNEDFEGPYSPISQATFLPSPSSDSTVFIIIGVVAGVLVVVAVIIIFLICRHRRGDGGKWPQFQEDVELAQLRNYPNMAIRQENSNYAVTHDGKEVLLPIFPRERLKLITFLGSGAFGEVFEGSALDILGIGSGESRVAVKTLRKGATDEEKQEFLKEATIMGKFKHPNIVSLLGVCLDNDPQFIILELMEGGDLLSYIRAARAPAPAKSKITLMDQLEIMLDVVKGCEHLEELHFVHRDLAARNCLVSTKSYDAHMRVVKIGDFGLARDIYKNDYYRKEGEGLLPVRWMSPEGLMDGYFSIQSDVWAFGVLMWEVMSKGQQPYPARSNVEVLRFVEAGGRLSQPDQCPDEIYMMMRRCWERSTEDRPSFKMLKEMIYDYRRKSVGPGGADNFGFEGDGKVNYSHVKEIPPEMEDYLLPMDSKGDIKKKPDVELPPDIDYDLAEKDLANAMFEEDQKKEKRKGSKKGRSPFSSLRGRLPGGAGAAEPTPRLEAALQDLANNRNRGRDIDDPRYLKHPVGSVSKATGDAMVNGADGGVAGATGSAGDDGSSEGAVGYSAGVSANGDAPNRTELPNYSQPRKRHPNPFRANSMEELDGYDNLAFASSGKTKPSGDLSVSGNITATDYANV